MTCHAPTNGPGGGGGTSYDSRKINSLGTSFDWSPGSFVAAITGPTFPQLVLLLADKWWQPYLVRGPSVMTVQTGPIKDLYRMFCKLYVGSVKSDSDKRHFSI